MGVRVARTRPAQRPSGVVSRERGRRASPRRVARARDATSTGVPCSIVPSYIIFESTSIVPSYIIYRNCSYNTRF